MNALMTIQIRVLSADARKRIRELEAEVAMLRRQVNSASRSMNTMGTRSIPAITKWGNQIQWAGRQLQYNFTLPIALAGIAATKFALDNEKAMVRVRKVYGDGSAEMNALANKEIPALEKAFVALSNRFGIAQADAINIAADWAAAGASGVALARSVKLTMETMVLGELEAKEATEALIAIQAQYNFSTQELTKTIDVLNMVENQTGISMQGLIQGMARSAGVAREMGVDVQHLAAMMAALVPATGSAAAAGNGLKTILSRIMSPTNEANEVMRLMGINTKEMAWQSLNATQRLEKMAYTYTKLDDAQKIVVATTAASRWQINRFGQLMTDINNPLGYYHRSLQSTADESKNFAQRQKELNTVLESSPQRLKQIWVMLQNTMAKVIQPAIPAILIMANAFAKLFQWFSNLDPAVQKLGLAFLFLLAAIGPIVRYMGSVAVLLGVLQEGFGFVGRHVRDVGKGIKWLAKGPFVLLGKAITGIPTMLAAIPAAFGGMGSKAGNLLRSGFMAAIAPFRNLFARALIPIRAIWITTTLGLQTIWAQTLASMRLAFLGFATSLANLWRGMVVGLLTITGMLRTQLIVIWMAMQRGILIATVSFQAAMTTIWGGLVAAAGVMRAGVTAAYAGAGAAMALLSPVAMVARFRALMFALPAIAAAAGAGIVRAFAMVRTGVMAIMASLATGPVGLIVAGIAVALGVLYNFKDKIRGIFQAIPRYFQENLSGFAAVWEGIANLFARGTAFIEKMFWKLPEGVRDALLTVLQIVQKIVMKVYEWLSYLNPFARHSPSLVDQVTKGMAVIRDQYASVGNVGGIFAKAARDIERYKRAIGTMAGGAFSDERADVAAAFKNALPIFDALIYDLTVLNKLLAEQAVAVAKQQAVVDAWEAALDQANLALDAEEAKLDKLKDKLDALNDAYAAHQQAMEDYASAPIEGMMAMEDQIFANQQAQNALRLEILKWEQANGSIEDVQNNMAKLAGSMEQLRGEEASLRAAGAGSDILGPIQSEIAAMEAAYDAMGNTVNNSPVGEMQAELEKLNQAGQILELEKSLQFDGMIREIDKLVNAQEELTFDEIVAGINAEKAAMAALEPQIASATAAVAAQQTAVDAAKASRDAIQATYDAENAKLQILENQYRRTADAIQEIESALNEMGNAASAAIQKAEAARNAAKGGAGSEYLSPGAQNFLAAEGGNFPDVSGTGAQIGREGGLEDQSALIDQFTKDTIAEMEATLGKIDMMGPIKEKWNQFTAWLEENVWSKLGGIVNDIKTIWNDLTTAISDSSIGTGAAAAWDGITSSLAKVWEWGDKLWKLFKDDLIKIWDEVVKAGQKIWDEIGPELAQFKDLIPGLTKIFKFLWEVLKVVAAVVGAALVGAFKILTSVLAHVLGPAIDMIIGVVKNLIKIFRGIIEFVVGVFTLDWKLAWQGIKDIFGGLFGGIAAIIEGVWDTVWGAVEGLVNGVIDWFMWLWDELTGHSIIPDMLQDIIDWFKGLPKRAWNALIDLKNKVIDVAKKSWDAMIAKSREMWNTFTTWLGGRPQAAYDKFIAIKTKLQDAAKRAWDAMKAKSLEIWNSFNTWLGGRPQAAYDKFISIREKLREAARAAFQAMKDKMKEMWDGRSGILTWIKGLPGAAANALKSMGSVVANSVKGAWNGAANWINRYGIDKVNAITSKFSVRIPGLPTFAGGGVIPGKVSARDNTIIAARTGEGVIVPELVRALGGARGLDAANRAAKTGNHNALRNMGIEGYESGGVIGTIGGIVGNVTGLLQKGAGFALSQVIRAMRAGFRLAIPGDSFFENWMDNKVLLDWQKGAQSWGDKQEAMGNGVLPGIGYQWQTKVLRQQFPNVWPLITSSFRPGAITALGNTSMHAQGRAVDIVPRDSIFDWIRSTYGKNTKQLFYSPKDGKTILNGRDWNMDAVTKRGHWDHIHWGYDKGGILPPGLTMARNSTGRNEVTLTADQWASFSNVVSMLELMSLKRATGATPGAAAVTRVGATLATVEARLRAAETRSSQATRSNGGGGDTFNFYGDLEFPNIKDGTDAEDFVRNLRGLAG